MTSLSKFGIFARVASRTHTRPEYLGWFLARYGESEKKTDREVAHLLEASMHDFHRLHLCLCPRHESFATDVQQIAVKFGVDTGELAKVIRHVEALEAIKDDRAADTVKEAGLLMAARARNKPKASARRKKNGTRSKS